jgi:hypothetical protein
VATRTTAVDVGAVALLALVSWAAYFAAGVRFDASPFPGYMQFIDADLLRDRMLESIWYWHAHPPGLNLLVGVAYEIFGGGAPTFLALLFNGLGVGVALGLFALTLRLTGTRVAAYLSTALVVMSPGFVLYENWLMYTFLEVVLLVASAVALYKTLDRGSTTWSVALFATLAVLVLTRGFFHLGWFVLVVCYVAWASPHRLRILKAAAVPLAVATLWYAKNYFYFGAFAGSTLFGLGLSNIGTLTATRAELAPLVDEGIVSPLALVSRYEDLSLLFSESNDPPSGIPVLDRRQKSTGHPNFNFLPLVEINEQYARDSIAVIRRYPSSYVIALLISNRLFFSPSSLNSYFSPENRAAAKPFERVFNPLVYGVDAEPAYVAQPHFGFDQPPSLEVDTSVRLMVWSALVVVLGWLRVRPAFFRREIDDRAALITLGYLLFVMLYVYGLGTLAELAENNRYRFVSEPFLAVLTAALATDYVRRLKARWWRDRAPVPESPR